MITCQFKRLVILLEAENPKHQKYLVVMFPFIYHYLEACNVQCQCVDCDEEFAILLIEECSDFFVVVVVICITTLDPQKRFRKRGCRIILILDFKSNV